MLFSNILKFRTPQKSADMLSTKQKLLGTSSSETPATKNKVSIVGVGQVGMACAFSILNQGMVNEIALSDVAAEKLKGEFMDLSQGMAMTKTTKIKADTSE